MAGTKKRVEEMLKEVSQRLCRGSSSERKEVMGVRETVPQKHARENKRQNQRDCQHESPNPICIFFFLNQFLSCVYFPQEQWASDVNGCPFH